MSPSMADRIPTQTFRPEIRDTIMFSQYPSNELVEQPNKRARASRPKVKSGCITCKARRVKCDETKPQCLRCRKFGRVCDGYATTPAAPRGLIQLQPRLPSTTLYEPSILVHVTKDEHQYFDYFAQRVANVLPGYFKDPFWSRLVLQESHNDAAIRHGVIALGALYRSLELSPPPQLKINVVQSFEKRHHEQSVLHYLKAIQLMNQYISNSDAPEFRNALIACLLFVCFETIQGSFASSIQQQYGGLKLLRSHYQSQAKPTGSSTAAGSSKRKLSRRQMTVDRAIAESDPVIDKHLNQFVRSDDTGDAVFDHRILPNHTILGLSSKEKDNLATSQLKRGKRAPGLKARSSSLSGKLQSPGGSLSLPRHNCATQSKDSNTTIMLTDADIVTSEPRSLSVFSLSDNSKTGSSSIASPTGSPRDSSPCGLGSVCETFLPQVPCSQIEHTIEEQTIVTQPADKLSSSDVGAGTISRRVSAQKLSTQPLLQRSQQVEESITDNFARLNNSGLFFGMAPAIPAVEWDYNNAWHLPIPPAFSSLVSAKLCWDFLMDRCLQFYRHTTFNRAFDPRKQDSWDNIFKQKAHYISQIAAFEDAFQPLLAAAIAAEDKTQHIPTLILSLYPRCTAMMLSQTTAPGEMAWDEFQASFEYIVQTCCIITNNEREEGLYSFKNRFSFDFAIVPPLHLTATKCRDPWLRRKAVDLLFSSPRQEGLWDSVLSARIGQWLISCEEEGQDVSLPLDDGWLFAGEKIPDSTPQQEVSSREDGRRKTGQSTAVQTRHSDTDVSHGEGSAIEQHDHRDTTTLPQRTKIPISNPHHPLHDPSTSTTTTATSTSQPTQSLHNTHNHNPKPFPLPPTRDQRKAYYVPETKRMQLTVVSFHIPDRCIKVKCERAVRAAVSVDRDGGGVSGGGGGGESISRETVLAW